MHKYKAPAWARFVYDVSGKLTEDFGCGPRHLKMAWVINLHKIITLFIIYGMMVHFDNFSTAAWVYLVLIAWYWLIPYLFISRHVEPSGPMLFLAIAMHTQGITWMIAGDCQKYFSLKYRKGLITSGVFRYTRNPNFLGEILIYASYAMLANHWAGYLVLGYATLFFLSRMHVKDESISRYPEWDAYAAGSNRLIPWRLPMAIFGGPQGQAT